MYKGTPVFKKISQIYFFPIKTVGLGLLQYCDVKLRIHPTHETKIRVKASLLHPPHSVFFLHVSSACTPFIP
jgi:hypothetical protein